MRPLLVEQVQSLLGATATVTICSKYVHFLIFNILTLDSTIFIQ